MSNVLHSLRCLNSWSPTDGAVWEVQEVWHCGGNVSLEAALRVYNSISRAPLLPAPAASLYSTITDSGALEPQAQINIFFYQFTWLWSSITATYKQVICDLNVINLQQDQKLFKRERNSSECSFWSQKIEPTWCWLGLSRSPAYQDLNRQYCPY